MIEIHRAYEQTIDTVSQDTLIRAEFSGAEADELTRSFREYIEEHRDEITALQVLYQRPYRQRLSLRRNQGAGRRAAESAPVMDLRRGCGTPTEQLDRDRVHGSGQRVLTDIVSLVRYAVGE